MGPPPVRCERYRYDVVDFSSFIHSAVAEKSMTAKPLRAAEKCYGTSTVGAPIFTGVGATPQLGSNVASAGARPSVESLTGNPAGCGGPRARAVAACAAAGAPPAARRNDGGT